MFLGIDIGTSSVKTILMNDAQQVLASASELLQVSRPQSNWSEQDAESWWQATCKTLDSLSSSHSDLMKQVRSIGLSGQMHGATLLDKNNKVLRPAILWNDGRSFEECKEIEKSFPQSRKVSGNIAMAGFTAPKIAWVRKYEPQIFEQISKVLLPKDYIRWCLTGEYISDMSDASGTLWLDVKKRDWSGDLLSATGLTQENMPTLVEGSDASADCRNALKDRWGFSKNVVVAGGAGDNAASACGMGTVDPSSAFVSLGTSGVLFVANEKFSPNTDSAVHAFCHALPNRWHQMGVILSATDSLQWFTKITGKSAAELTQALGSDLSKASPVSFLPYLGGERTPHNDSNIRGSFTGLGHEHDTNTLTQAILEGVAYAFKDSQLALQKAGTDFDSAFAIGGGAKSEIWLKIIASVLNKPLNIPKSGEFGAAFGAARLAMCASDKLDPESVCTKPEIEKVIEPESHLVEEYQQGYERFTKSYPAIKDL